MALSYDRPDGPRAPKPMETIEQYQRVVDEIWVDEREQVERWTIARREDGVGEPMCDKHNVLVAHDDWSVAFCAGYLGFKDIGTFVMTIFQDRGCCQAVSGLFREMARDWKSEVVHNQIVDLDPLTLSKVLGYLQQGRITLASIESGYLDVLVWEGSEKIENTVALLQAHRFLRMCLRLRDYLDRVGVNIFLGSSGPSTVYSDLRWETEDIGRAWTLFQTWYKVWRHQNHCGDAYFVPETSGWSEQPVFWRDTGVSMLPDPVYLSIDVGNPLHRALVQDSHRRMELVLHTLDPQGNPETVVLEVKVKREDGERSAKRLRGAE